MLYWSMYTCNFVNFFFTYLRIDYYVHPGYRVSYHPGESKCFSLHCHYFSLILFYITLLPVYFQVVFVMVYFF